MRGSTDDVIGQSAAGRRIYTDAFERWRGQHSHRKTLIDQGHLKGSLASQLSSSVMLLCWVGFGEFVARVEEGEGAVFRGGQLQVHALALLF